MKSMKSMKIRLSMNDRLFLNHSVLPAQGTYEMMLVAGSIYGKTEFTESEIKEHEIATHMGETGINKDSDKKKSFDFREEEWAFIKLALLALDKKKELKKAHLRLYAGFVMGEGI